MRRPHCEILIVFFLICLSGTEGSGNPSGLRQVPGPDHGPDPSQHNTKKENFYHPIEAGELRDKNGTHLSFTTWEGADGSKVRVIHKDFGSRVWAKDFFEEMVGRAKKIVKRGKQVDKMGKVVGERAVVVFPSDETDQTTRTPSLLFTVGSNYYGVESNSFAAIQEWEKH